MTGASARTARFLADARALWRYLAPYWPYQLLVLLIALLGAVVGLMGPYLTRVTIDHAFAPRDRVVFHAMLALGAAVFMFLGWIGLLNRLVSTFIGARLTFMLRRDYIRHLFRLPYLRLSGRSTGEQLYRLGGDIDAIAALATNVLPQAVSALARVLCLLLLCLWMNWRLAVGLVALTPLIYLHSRWFGARQADQTRTLKEAGQGVMGLIQDRVAHFRLVKGLGLEARTVRAYMAGQINLVRRHLALMRLGTWGSGTAGLLNTAATTAIAYYLGRQVIAQTITLGTLVALSMYLGQLLLAMTGLAGLYRSARVTWVSWGRVLETLRLEPERDGARHEAGLGPHGAVSVRGLTFGYQPGVPVLHAIDLDLPAGAFVGLAGPSGSGKSTLLMLLCRILTPSGGHIAIDGVPLADWRADALHRTVAAALQDGAVLDLTIRENLRLGWADATDDRIAWALDVAALRTVVAGLPDGLDARVGEGGHRLSEGQRQRLSLARAILARPRVLLLDEVTAAVGADTEAEIVARLRTDLPETTLVLASHRLLTMQSADRIIVLDGGRLAGNGTHDALLASCALYRRLYRAARGNTNER